MLFTFRCQQNNLFFHVSSKKCAPRTDSNRFRERIRQALRDVKAIFAADSESTSFEKGADVPAKVVESKNRANPPPPLNPNRKTLRSNSVIKMGVKDANKLPRESG